MGGGSIMKGATGGSPLGMVGNLAALGAAPFTGGASLFAIPAMGAIQGGLGGGAEGALGGALGGSATAALGGAMLPGANPFAASGALGGLTGSSIGGSGLTAANIGGSTSGLSQAAQSAINPGLGAGMGSTLTPTLSSGFSPALSSGSLVGPGLTAANTGITPSMMSTLPQQTPGIMSTLGNSANIMNGIGAAGDMFMPQQAPMQPMQLDNSMSLPNMRALAPNAFGIGS